MNTTSNAKNFRLELAQDEEKAIESLMFILPEASKVMPGEKSTIIKRLSNVINGQKQIIENQKAIIKKLSDDVEENQNKITELISAFNKMDEENQYHRSYALNEREIIKTRQNTICISQEAIIKSIMLKSIP